MTKNGWKEGWFWFRLNSIEKMLFYKMSALHIDCDMFPEVIEQYKLVSKDEWEGVNVIRGETMTSPWSIVKAYYETFKMNYQKAEDKGVYSWIASISENDGIDLGTDCLLDFVDKAYSVGNFCRVPRSLSKRLRGMGKFSQMFK